MEIIDRIQDKINNILDNSRENRARKGAYVDCLVMLKEEREQKLSEQQSNCNLPHVSNSCCPKGCKGLIYTHDDRVHQSCCECDETWAI